MSTTSGAAFSTDCLYSVVKNISGTSKVFGFLPPHGATLDDQEEFVIWGNLLEAISRGDPACDRRYHQALKNAIDHENIQIVSLPNPILLDTISGDTKMVQLTSGSLSAVDPCWLTSDSLEVIVPD